MKRLLSISLALALVVSVLIIGIANIMATRVEAQETTAGEDKLVITPEFVIWNNGYYIDFVDNVTVTKFVWKPDRWLLFGNITLHNTKPENLEIYFKGGNITVEKFYESGILLSGKLYFNESVMEIILVLRVLPNRIVVGGKDIPQVASWYTWRDSQRSVYWLDIYNHKVYIKLYKSEFTSASLVTWFPLGVTEGVSFTLYETRLGGEILPVELRISVLLVLVVIALAIFVVIRRNRIHINNFLQKLSFEVKE